MTAIPDTGSPRAGLNVHTARCDALFVSDLQRSDAPNGAAVTAAIGAAVRRFGVRGCAARMAQEFGDHPEAAAERMRWIRQIVAEVPACAARNRQRELQSAVGPAP